MLIIVWTQLFAKCNDRSKKGMKLMFLKKVAEEKGNKKIGKRLAALAMCLMLTMAMGVCAGCGKKASTTAPKSETTSKEDKKDTEKKEDKKEETTTQQDVQTVAEYYAEQNELYGGSVAVDIEYYVTVVNNSGVEVNALYAAEAGTGAWSDNFLAAGTTLATGTGEMIPLTLTSGQFVWDLALEDVNGKRIELTAVDFTECDIDGITVVVGADGKAEIF